MLVQCLLCLLPSHAPPERPVLNELRRSRPLRRPLWAAASIVVGGGVIDVQCFFAVGNRIRCRRIQAASARIRPLFAAFEASVVSSPGISRSALWNPALRLRPSRTVRFGGASGHPAAMGRNAASSVSY